MYRWLTSMVIAVLLTLSAGSAVAHQGPHQSLGSGWSGTVGASPFVPADEGAGTPPASVSGVFHPAPSGDGADRGAEHCGSFCSMAASYHVAHAIAHRVAIAETLIPGADTASSRIVPPMDKPPRI